MYYVQFDNNGKVHTICELAGEVKEPTLVAIEAWDESLIGSYYDPQTNTFQHIETSVDKTAIKADGTDTATITAKVPTVLMEITFYHIDTGEPIATVPVDPVTHTATLKVTATTPGVIKIRAGEPTVTKLNEVVITAQ